MDEEVGFTGKPGLAGEAAVATAAVERFRVAERGQMVKTG